MRRYLLFIILSIFVLLCFAQKTQKHHMRDAEKVAIKWLSKLNNKEYVDCWNMLSKQTQGQSNYQDWNAYFSTELMPELGDFISREYYLAEIEKEMQGLKEGLYVTVRYNSVYANTESIEEVVLLNLLENGQWKILSYFTEYQLKDDTGEIPKSKLGAK